jgi:hypothetical protein
MGMSMSFITASIENFFGGRGMERHPNLSSLGPMIFLGILFRIGKAT